MNAISGAHNTSDYINNNEVNTNRSHECFLTLDGVKGPVKEIAPGSFSVNKYFIYAFRDIQVGRTGLLQPGGVNTVSHLSLIIPTPNVLPVLQQDCFSGRVYETATVKNFGNINENNREILELTLTDARLSMVTSNFDPESLGASMESRDIFGGTTSYDGNRALMMQAAKRFPDPKMVPQVLLKLAFKSVMVTATHHHDGGDESGKTVTKIDLSSNTASEG